jgi:DNA-directed RNA polymerase specialized sigma24 family protein
MPNNSSDNLRDQEVNTSPFTALLNFLCPDDPDEANRQYLRLHQKLTAFFRFKGMSDPENDAEDTLERAGKKILEGVPIPDIDRFCLGIARNVVLERLRKQRQEESAFKQFIEKSKEDNTDVERITKLMKQCFEKLPKEDRDLLHSYCKIPPGISRAEHRLRLADKLGLSIAALRIRVARLRRALERCVKLLSKNQ